jgi:hypothetical protein
MTPTEFQYIKRAVEALEGSMSVPSRIKVQRTMAQILDRSAQLQEEQFCELVDTNIERNRLVDILKR